MNDKILTEGASSISEKTVERFLQYEEKIRSSPKFFNMRHLKIAAVACVCLIISCMTFVAAAIGLGGYVKIDFSEIFDYKKIESITITGGAFDSTHIALRKEEDINRFCKMFDFWFDVYMTPEPTIIVNQEEPKDKENLVPSNSCGVVIKQKDSSDVIILTVNPDNTFVLLIDGSTYICNNTYLLDYKKIKSFK